MMIRDGVLEDPKVDQTLSMHLWNDMPVGWVGAAGGPVMAGAELFTLKLTGKGGHGAAPHMTIDPIVTAAQVVTALQTITSRNISPLETAVVSVTTLQSGTAFNVIPQEAVLTGTIRTFDLGVRRMVLERFDRIVHGIAETFGCQVEIDVKRVTPAVINNDDLATRVQGTARRILPNLDLETGGYLTMGAEDMAFMHEKVPGCYFFIGSNNKEKHLDYGHHHPKFDFDEEALIRGAALMASAAADILSG
jgi:amidohydrolase